MSSDRYSSASPQRYGRPSYLDEEQTPQASEKAAQVAHIVPRTSDLAKECVVEISVFSVLPPKQEQLLHQPQQLPRSRRLLDAVGRKRLNIEVGV